MRYVVVRPNTTVDKITQAMSEHNQMMFPIVSDGNKFLGYILEEDLEAINNPAGTTAIEAHAKAVGAGKLRNSVVHPDDPFSDAVITMLKNRLPFVPVVRLDSEYMGTIDDSAVAASATRHSR